MSQHHRIRIEDGTVRFEKRGWFGAWPLRAELGVDAVRRIRLDVHNHGAFDITRLTLETASAAHASEDDEPGHDALWTWLERHFDIDPAEWQGAARDHIIASPGTPMQLVIWERR